MDPATLRALSPEDRARWIAQGTPEQQRKLAEAIRRVIAAERVNKFSLMFPETGALRRELYAKHLEFFRLGASKKFRLFLGATGCGKTEGAGGFEAVCHLTGVYPAWWEGKRFAKPVTMWIGANTNETFRDSVQIKLFGKRDEWGTGLIPGALLGKPRFNGTPADSLDFCYVKHVSGKWSKVTVKPYSAGRESFEAADVDVIWLDEEPSGEIVSSASGRFRGATAGGVLFMTYTPFDGITDVVQRFVPQFIPNFDRATYEAAGNACVVCSSKDVPHETPDPAHFMPHEREARLNGIPSVGSGKIWPVPESDFVVADFPIPKHWPRAFGADFGYGSVATESGGTGVVWGAIDQKGGDPTAEPIVYITEEYFRSLAEITIHATSIKLRGDWIPGAGDYSGVGRDGEGTIVLYRAQKIDIVAADKSVDPGLFQVFQMLSTGRLKIFASCVRLINEMRMYRRDERGKVVKADDHLCLHPDTMVLTDAGKRKIKSLVGTTGRVLTVGGEYADYEHCRLTGMDQQTVAVNFDDGSRVICTPDHLFLTANGWVQAQYMEGIGCYNAVAQSIQKERRWTRPLSLQPFKSLRGFGTTFAASIFSAGSGLLSVCTGPFGKRPISGLCLMGSLSTTLTRTDPTTRLAIWNSWFTRSTAPTTIWATSANSPKPQLTARASGTDRKPVKSGIASTISSTLKSFTRFANSLASIAARNSRRSRLAPTGSARIIARLNRAAFQAWTMLSEFVLGAARRFQSTVTRGPKTAQRNAPPFLRCVSVTPAGLSDVYCLEVPSTHAFAVESGAVVHNCDALRYLVMTGLKRAKTQPVPRQPTNSGAVDLGFHNRRR